MIAATDHFYAGKEDVLARTIDAWLRETLRWCGIGIVELA